MKRLAVVLGALALSMAMGIPVRGYENPQNTQDEKKPELMDIKGTVRSDNTRPIRFGLPFSLGAAPRRGCAPAT